MKPGPHVIEIRDANGNLFRKAVGSTGCLGMLLKVATTWLGRALWFGFGMLIGYVWNG